MTKDKRIGAAAVKTLNETVATDANAGIGDAFSIERAAGRAIEQMRRVCNGMQLPTVADIVVTYLFCDDLQSAAILPDFGKINRVWTTDRSIKFADLANRIILLSRNGGAGAISSKPYDSLDEQADAVERFGLMQAAAITFQLSASVVTIYSNGMGAEIVEERGFGTIPSILQGNELLKHLKHFDEKWANAPLGHKVLWATFQNETHVPCSDTEKVIQDRLQLSLISADRSLAVIDEIPNASGRSDLHIYSGAPATAGSTVLELKVLRYCSHPKPGATHVTKIHNSTNKKNAEEVVKQASEYKDELQSSRALARIYDMRRDPLNEDTILSAQALATALGVELTVSRIHYSSQQKRNANVKKKLAGKKTNCASK